MNGSLSRIVPFTNLSREIVYNADIPERISLQLFGPLIDTIQNYLYRSFSQYPDFVLSELREHHNLTSTNTIRNGLYATLVPMLFGYLLVIAGLVAGIVFPVSCYTGLCWKKSINISKYQVCFCLEGFVFIIACVFLAFSTAGSIQAAVNVDESLEFYPNLGVAVVDDILTSLDHVKANLDVLRHDMYIVLENKLQCLMELPYRIVNSLKDLLYPSVQGLQFQFIHFYENFEDAINKSGLITTGNGDIHHLIELAMEEVEMKISEVRIYLQNLKEKILFDESLAMNEKQNLLLHISAILKEATIDFHKAKMLNWTHIYKHLNYTYHYLLPLTNHSVFFINSVPHGIGQEMEPVIKNIQFHKLAIESWANTSLKKMQTITDKFISKNSLLEFKTVMHKFTDKARSLDITSQNSQFSGRALLLLMPGFHSLIVLFIMIIASIVGIHEIRRLNATNQVVPQYKVNYGAKVLQSGALFGLAFLWLHLILAGIVYMSSIMLTTLCLPITDLTIFTRYTDDIKVWRNRTWIDSVMEEFSYNYSERMKLLEILRKCQENQTLYTALNMEKYWDIKQYMRLDSLQMQESVVMHAVDSAMHKIQLPNIEFVNAIYRELDSVIEDLNLSFTKHVVKEMQNLKYNHMTTEILSNIPYEQKYEYIKDGFRIILYEIEKIEHRSMELILQNISQLTELKQKLILCKNELPALIPVMTEINNVMEHLSRPLTHEIISSVLVTADSFVKHFQNHAERSVKHDIGNCHILYSLFKKVSWAVCNSGHDLLIGIWLALGLTGISMTITIVLAVRIAGYFKGAHKTHYHWKRRLHYQKWNETRVVNSDALLFDEETGKFLGNAVMVPVPASISAQTKPNAVTVHPVCNK